MKSMITMSTMELRGMLADVIPFASTADDDPAFNCIRLEWDGEKLIAQASDRFRMAQLTWTADEETYDDDADSEALIALYGAEDGLPAFKVRIGLADAQNVVRAFTLKGPKKQFAPVGIVIETESVSDNTYTVRFTRAAGGDAWTALTFKAAARGASRAYSDDIPEGDLTTVLTEYRDIAESLAKVPENQFTEAHIPRVAFTAKLIAGWAKARDHGPVEMSFTGADRTIWWKMGHRYEGTIQPIRANKPKPAAEDVPFDFDSEDD